MVHLFVANLAVDGNFPCAAVHRFSGCVSEGNRLLRLPFTAARLLSIYAVENFAKLQHYFDIFNFGIIIIN